MDMLEPSLEHTDDDKTNDSDDAVPLTPSGDDEGNESGIATVAALDSSGVRYQFQTDTNAQGHVTYRVIQVAQDGTEATQIVAPASFPTQVLAAGFGNANSPGGDSGERYAYFPQGTTGLDAATTQGTDGTAAAIGAVTAAGGQFYVMMSPQDVIQGQRAIAPRTAFPVKQEGRTNRDDRRRATHNEVERRRRDKINNWIVQLSKLVPDSMPESSKSGQISNSSKGGILAKACEYITELRTANSRMAESLKETERLQIDTELLRQQNEELKQENTLLRAQIQPHSIVTDLTNGPS